MKMKPKSLDCVEIKHAAALNIQRKLRGKSLKEKLAFWGRQEKAMLNRRKRRSTAVI